MSRSNRWTLLALGLSALLIAASVVRGCFSSATSPGRVTITFATTRDETGLDRRLIEQFERENPDIRVEKQEMPLSTDDVHNQYAISFIAEDPSVDCYSIDVIWPAEFASAGWALPLDDLFPESERKLFLQATIDACTYRGHVYAVPWYTDAGLLFYRRDILEEHALAPPRTWDELRDLSLRLQIEGKRNGFVFQGAQYEGMICAFLEFVWGNGGEVLDSNGEARLDSDRNVEALQFIIDLMYRDRVVPEAVKTFKEHECMAAFRAGRVVFMRNWPYAWGLTQTPGEPLLGKVGMAPMPHSRSHSTSAATLGGWSIMISRFTRHRDEAWRFVRFLTSYDAQKARFLDSTRLPARKGVYADTEVLERHPEVARFLEIFQLARPRPVTPYYSKLSDIMQIQVHRALSGQVDARTALQEAARGIRAIPGFEQDVSDPLVPSLPGNQRTARP